MKYHITLSLDAEVYLQMKSRRVNFSKIVNNFLKSYLETESFKAENLNEDQLDKEWFVTKQKLLEIEQTKEKRDREERKRVRVVIE